MYYLKGGNNCVKKKSEYPENLDSNVTYQSFRQYKRSYFGKILAGGGILGASGMVGVYSQCPFWQLVIIEFIECIGLLIMCIPDLLEFYKIYLEHKNDTPEENEMRRKHEKEMKEIEYKFLLDMKDKEIEEKKYISDVQMLSGDSRQTDILDDFIDINN